MTTAPERPEIYHIVHMDRLAPIIRDGFIWCDAEVSARSPCGTTIGMPRIKEIRRGKCLRGIHGLTLSDCVPFYFCARSVMLYLLYKRNHPELSYRGGQDPIVHLKADMREAVDWAEAKGLSWAFTAENAASASAQYYGSWDFLQQGAMGGGESEELAALQGAQAGGISGTGEIPVGADFADWGVYGGDTHTNHEVASVSVRQNSLQSRARLVLLSSRRRP